MLYDAMMVPCVFMEKVRVADGLGGWSTSWQEGAQFDAAIVKNNSSQVVVAEAQGMEQVYLITVHKEVPIAFHDVIKRVSDGFIFQITSEKLDNQSPSFSAINFGQFNARAWKLVE